MDTTQHFQNWPAFEAIADILFLCPHGSYEKAAV